MNNQEFMFEKKLVFNTLPNTYENFSSLHRVIGALMQCLLENNEKEGVQCQYFKLEYRMPTEEERRDCWHSNDVLDFQWGSKKEMEKVNE